MNRVALSLFVGTTLASIMLAPAAEAETIKKPVILQPRVRPPADDVLAVKVTAVAGATAGAKLITVTVSNVSKSSALWIDWQLKVKGASGERFLGLGNIANLNGAEKHTITAEYFPHGEAVTIEASVAPASTEASAAARANNVKSVAVLATTLPAGLQAVDLNPALAAASGATHQYTPRSGMTGCAMTAAPQGNGLGVTFNCTAPGAGDIEPYKNFTLKQGWKVNGVFLSPSGGGTVIHRQVLPAGGAAASVRTSITGSPNQNPAVLVRVELVGPVDTSPY